MSRKTHDRSAGYAKQDSDESSILVYPLGHAAPVTLRARSKVNHMPMICGFSFSGRSVASDIAIAHQPGPMFTSLKRDS